jgi:1-deoxy-D-xylulose-5-phosphate reductoisomerase
VALAREAGERGGTAPAVLNAANEEAVALFLQGQRRFVDIVPSVARAVEAAEAVQELTLDALIAADRWARAHVRASAKGTSRLWSQLPA